MNHDKHTWTPALYLRMRRAASIMTGACVVAALAAFAGLQDDFELLPLGMLVASLFGVAATLRMRSVFGELLSVVPEKSGEKQKQDVAADAPARSPVPRMSIAAMRGGAPARPRRSEPWVTIDWEQWVGTKLLQKVGVIIVLIGMLVFLKYSFDNRWVDELGRVFLSVIAGGVLLGMGEFYHRLYARWAQAFTGGGLALLYLTVWVAHVLYAEPLAENYGLVVPAGLALVLYGFITLTGALGAVRYNAQTIAWFTVLGGYVTPLLVAAQPDTTALLIYLAMLAGGLILLAWRRTWRYLSLAAFVLTQYYLYTSVYSAGPVFSDVYQIVTASAFFLLFNVLPILYQFRLGRRSDHLDIALIAGNGLAVFLPVVDALGGWGSGYTVFVCFALAAFYLPFAVLALRGRDGDTTLINTYLTGTVLLVAGGFLAELEREWVAAAWAPLSLLLTFIASRLNRRAPWLLAWALLVGALCFLIVNVPVITFGSEQIWYPFTSNWAIQSYVAFASVVGWLWLLRRMPGAVIGTSRPGAAPAVLHGVLAAVLFLGVTFEATRMNFDVDLVWTLAYVALGVTAMAAFFFTESVVWFMTALIVQVLALLFIFGSGDSALGVFGDDPVRPFLHPWSYISVLALLAVVSMAYLAQIKRGSFVRGIPAHIAVACIAVAQVWVHVSVEIANMSDAYGWTSLVQDRALTAWWIAAAFGVMAYAGLKNSRWIMRASLGMLVIPFLFTHFSIIDGGNLMAETIVWTVLSIGLAVTGARTNKDDLLQAGMLFLAVAAGVDMLSHMGDDGIGLVRSSWWALTALAVMAAGFVERQNMLRRLAMVLFGATALKLLLVDFNALETPVRIGASLMTGLLMIGASYLYQRFDSMLKPAPAHSRD